MSDDFSFIYSKQFRDRMEHLSRQASNTPQMRRATEIALESARASGYRSVASEYFRANTPEISRGVLSALSNVRGSATRSVVDSLVEHLRTNPSATSFAGVPVSTLPALSRMVAASTVVGSQFDTGTILALFEQVRRAQPEEDEDVPPELAGVVKEEYESIPESDRQTLTPQQVRLIKEIVRYLVISTFVCLYLTAQQGTELWKYATDVLAAYGIVDDKVNKAVESLVEWADVPECGSKAAEED